MLWYDPTIPELDRGTFHGGKLPELLTLNLDNSCSEFVLGFSFIRAKLSLKSSPCLGLSFNVDNLEQKKEIQFAK